MKRNTTILVRNVHITETKMLFQAVDTTLHQAPYIHVPKNVYNKWLSHDERSNFFLEYLSQWNSFTTCFCFDENSKWYWRISNVAHAIDMVLGWVVKIGTKGNGSFLSNLFQKEYLLFRTFVYC